MRGVEPPARRPERLMLGRLYGSAYVRNEWFLSFGLYNEAARSSFERYWFGELEAAIGGLFADAVIWRRAVQARIEMEMAFVSRI